MPANSGFIGFVLGWVYLCLTLSLLLNRLYVRLLRCSSSNLWSDFLVVAAWCFMLPQPICVTIALAYGFDHFDEMPFGQGPRSRHFMIWQVTWYITVVIYFIPYYCVKGAILFFLMELTPPPFRRLRLAMRLALALCAIGLPFSVLGAAFCYRAALTARVETLTRDVNLASWAYLYRCSAIAYHVLTDFYIYSIPFFLIRHVKIESRSKRVGIYFMFGMGFVVVCLSFFQLGIFPPKYATWCGLHEQYLAIMMACLPALRMTLQRLYRSYSERQSGAETPARRRVSFAVRVKKGELSTMEVVRGRCQVIGEPKDAATEITDINRLGHVRQEVTSINMEV